MKLDFTKNRVLFISLCVGLIVVLIVSSVWKQQTRLVEGMIMMDFTTPSNPESGESLTDMDLQSFNSAMIPFEKKFETVEKAKSAIKSYMNGYQKSFDTSGNEVEDIGIEGISSNGLDSFVKHLETSGKAFQQFADALKTMKKTVTDDAIQKKQQDTALIGSV